MKESNSRYLILKLGADGILVEDSFARNSKIANDRILIVYLHSMLTLSMLLVQEIVY